MEQLRVGILSTGNIAATMADTVAKMKEARIYAVASRSLEKAEAFAERFQIEKAYGSYEEMAADENVDLVYVASPMSEHYENVKMLIAHGRNVLCEKAFAINQKQAREMTELAREKGVLLAEAMWVSWPGKKECCLLRPCGYGTCLCGIPSVRYWPKELSERL